MKTRMAGAAVLTLTVFAVSAAPTPAALLPPVMPARQTQPGQSAPRATPAEAQPFDGAAAWSHLQRLVAFGPRPSGSAALRQTRAYITRQLADMGLTVQEQPFIASTPLGRIEMVNLVVRLPGRTTDRILVAGHYDTKLMRNERFVGANDGGSSAAFLIELARVLKARPRELTHELVWFDGEEAMVDWQGQDNTYGSRYYVEAATKADALPSIKAMILVDMIGDRDLQLRRETNSTPWLVDLIWAAARRTPHEQNFLDTPLTVEDDHLPFLAAGVPSVDLIDFDYPYWHTAGDTLERVDGGSLQVVGDVLLAALPDIEDRLVRAPNRDSAPGTAPRP